MPAAVTPNTSFLDAVLQRALDGEFACAAGTDPSEAHAAVGFLTVQAAKHTGRSTGYVNTVVSVRVGAAVGSCAVEPGAVDEHVVQDAVGHSVRELLAHPEPAVRVAALDAYLAFVAPHATDPRARQVVVPAGSSLQKSTARARAVAALTSVPDGGRVAVIGVVNSLLSALRERGIDYVPCDLKGGHTEWGEPIVDDYVRAVADADAVVASGMVLGNGTFDDIAERCLRRDLPLTMFAQTGAAVLRELLGAPVRALSAEPYPFFWLTGDSSTLYSYEVGRS